MIKVSGLLVACGTLALPYRGPDDPLQQCGVRVVCFFYAFKLLDLALTKADDPPKLLRWSCKGRGAFMEQAEYVWLLLTEMRYHSFDNAAIQKGRPANQAGEDITNKVLPPLIIVTVAYAFPIAETKCLLLLCVIWNALEAVHSLLHPRCPHKLFYKPFSAATLGDFWTVHWHCSAVFLQSLAYKPGRRLVGRWSGVLTAFALSGVWHGWASMPLVDDEFALKLGLQVYTFFVMLGVGTLLERAIWRDKQRDLPQRCLVWGGSLAWAGWCFRTLECHSKIDFLRNERCNGG